MRKVTEHKPPEWPKWKIDRINEALALFTKMKKVPENGEYVDRLAKLESELEIFRKNIRMIFIKIIAGVPGLRMYMLVHSVFSVGLYGEHDDWFQRLMADILEPSDDDVGRFLAVPEVPAVVLQTLRGFDPEPVGYVMDNTRLEYHITGERQPIKVVDTDWDKINVAKPAEFVQEKCDIIDTVLVAQSSFILEDSDLPF